jgi:DNA invertase Pin-like site-specific DNA recombinase
VSGARSDRAKLTLLLKRIEAGNVVIVTRLNRLARSTRDLLKIRAVVAKKDAGFKSLSNALNHDEALFD